MSLVIIAGKFRTETLESVLKVLVIILLTVRTRTAVSFFSQPLFFDNLKFVSFDLKLMTKLLNNSFASPQLSRFFITLLF